MLTSQKKKNLFNSSYLVQNDLTHFQLVFHSYTPYTLETFFRGYFEQHLSYQATSGLLLLYRWNFGLYEHTLR